MKEKKVYGIGRGAVISIAAQALSLAISLISGFIIPRYIDEFQYAYREVYNLYISYVYLLHIGLLDGIMLRYSQYDYDELDQPRFRSQFRILICTLTGVSITTILVAAFFLQGVFRSIVFLLAIGLITKNIVSYNSYCFQITNQIGEYAKLIFYQRIVYGVLIVVLLLCGVNSFILYCLADLTGDVLVIALSLRHNKSLCLGHSLPIKEAWREWYNNISVGFILLLANISSSLILGISKMIIQWKWDELIFGKVAFAFSMTSLFLVFANALSVVLFPALKRMDEERLVKLYMPIREGLSMLIVTLMLGYFPLSFVVKIVLPKYSGSVEYLGILLPMIMYSSKVGVLTNNYLKAYRKEKMMLRINIISIMFSAIICGISSNVFAKVEMVLVCAVIAVVVNYVLSELYVAKLMGIGLKRELLLDIMITICFMFLVNNFPLHIALLGYFLCVLLYLVIQRDHICMMVNRLIRGRI